MVSEKQPKIRIKNTPESTPLLTFPVFILLNQISEEFSGRSDKSHMERKASCRGNPTLSSELKCSHLQRAPTKFDFSNK